MTMQEYRIRMVKEYEEKGRDFDQYLSNSPTFRNLGSFKRPKSFSSQSIDSQKRFVRKKLQMITRDSLPFNVNKAKVGSKERIMVFEKGNYGMDEAVYDSQTKIPSHLQARKQRVEKR